mmetsp:Transcript_9248/g.14029  ORF Transcript_9248/g.14029 Transcript_9248/m.14029 type:complete len:228 (-) Transcript_9248:26-709(-)
MKIAFLLFTDSSLGKVDKGSLSEETLMELLIEGITTGKERICGSRDNPLEVHQWSGLMFNDGNEILKIGWEQLWLQGSIQLQWLPRAVTHFVIWGNALSGSLDFTDLPPNIFMLSFHSNRFEGTIDLSNLPKSLETISLTNNRLSGNLDLSHLPDGIRRLYLNENAFEGQIDFTTLPESLKLLDIRHTKFSGVTMRTLSRDVRAEFSNVNLLSQGFTGNDIKYLGCE